MLLPQEIAEQLKPAERSALAGKVQELWGQAYGVVSVDRKASGVVVVVELEDNTHHEVALAAD